MEGEFYVANLLHSSEEARRYVAALLGWRESTDALEFILRFSQRERLRQVARELECLPAAVFKQLIHVLEGPSERMGAQTPRQAWSPLTDEDLQLLLQKQTRKIIGNLLGCDEESALQGLFDPDELRSLIEDAKIDCGLVATAQEADVESLLYSLLLPRNQQTVTGCLGTRLSRWTGLPYLLKESARNLLVNRLGCSPSDVLRALIASIKESATETQVSFQKSFQLDRESLDSIGLSKLQRQLEAIEDELLGFTSNAAQRAAAQLGGFRRAELLYPIVEFYVRGHYQRALDVLMRDTQSLRQIAFNAEILAENLTAPEHAPLQGILGPEPDTLVVQCCPDTNRRPVDILRLRGLAQEQRQHIFRYLPRTVGELDKNANILAERLLDTRFPTSSPTQAKWRHALEGPIEETISGEILEVVAQQGGPDREESQIQSLARLGPLSQRSGALDPRIVQCFVLSGVSLRPADVTELPALGLTLEIGAFQISGDSRNRIDFPLGPHDIAEKLVGEYKSQRKRLKPIPVRDKSDK